MLSIFSYAFWLSEYFLLSVYSKFLLIFICILLLSCKFFVYSVYKTFVYVL